MKKLSKIFMLVVAVLCCTVIAGCDQGIGPTAPEAIPGASHDILTEDVMTEDILTEDILVEDREEEKLLSSTNVIEVSEEGYFDTFFHGCSVGKYSSDDTAVYLNIFGSDNLDYNLVIYAIVDNQEVILDQVEVYDGFLLGHISGELDLSKFAIVGNYFQLCPHATEIGMRVVVANGIFEGQSSRPFTLWRSISC